MGAVLSASESTRRGGRLRFGGADILPAVFFLRVPASRFYWSVTAL